MVALMTGSTMIGSKKCVCVCVCVSLIQVISLCIKESKGTELI